MKPALRSALIGTMLAVAALLTSGCKPEVGSDAWCKDMKEKPQGDWTINEAADFAKFCVLRLKPDDFKSDE